MLFEWLLTLARFHCSYGRAYSTFILSSVCFFAVYRLPPLIQLTQALLLSLVGDTNDTASRSGTSVASLEGLLVATLAEIVGAGMDNDGSLTACQSCSRGTGVYISYADDAVGADQLDQGVGGRALGVALGIGLDVAEIANVAGLVGGSTVGLLVRVEVRAGRGAAVGVVTKGVDVEAPLGVGVVAGDVPGDSGRGRLGVLLEDDGARDLGVATDNADCEVPMLASC